VRSGGAGAEVRQDLVDHRRLRDEGDDSPAPFSAAAQEAVSKKWNRRRLTGRVRGYGKVHFNTACWEMKKAGDDGTRP